METEHEKAILDATEETSRDLSEWEAKRIPAKPWHPTKKEKANEDRSKPQCD